MKLISIKLLLPLSLLFFGNALKQTINSGFQCCPFIVKKLRNNSLIKLYWLGRVLTESKSRSSVWLDVINKNRTSFEKLRFNFDSSLDCATQTCFRVLTELTEKCSKSPLTSKNRVSEGIFYWSELAWVLLSHSKFYNMAKDQPVCNLIVNGLCC